MTTPTHDLALARAERDAWQSTCEELHRTIAGRDVEIEAHLGRIEAAERDAAVKASQRDTFERALAAEREASRGLVAQVAELRSLADRIEADRDTHVAELAAIRDLVPPGNPQGTVADAVRAMIDMDRRYRDTADEDARAAIDRADKADQERDAAIARAEKAEGDAYTMRSSAEENRGALVDVADDLLVNTVGVTSTDIATRCGAAVAKLRVELAELRARPVLTEGGGR